MSILDFNEVLYRLIKIHKLLEDNGIDTQETFELFEKLLEQIYGDYIVDEMYNLILADEDLTETWTEFYEENMGTGMSKHQSVNQQG